MSGFWDPGPTGSAAVAGPRTGPCAACTTRTGAPAAQMSITGDPDGCRVKGEEGGKPKPPTSVRPETLRQMADPQVGKNARPTPGHGCGGWGLGGSDCMFPTSIRVVRRVKSIGGVRRTDLVVAPMHHECRDWTGAVSDLPTYG